ncbi:hypothetical protein Z946_426 [Sulfitobacter noctilucicola]|nr:hypothetical protein Z946_426 [Sulfitobacter noctilucicola]
MMGVVLWSDLDDQKAVFWCEDHGDLAYFDGFADAHQAPAFFAAGDMVEFEVTLDGNMRRASCAQVVQQKVCRGLQDHLRSTAQDHVAAEVYHASGGDVVPFRPKTIPMRTGRRLLNG